jgi:hypothetical protein
MFVGGQGSNSIPNRNSLANLASMLGQSVVNGIVSEALASRKDFAAIRPNLVPGALACDRHQNDPRVITLA